MSDTFSPLKILVIEDDQLDSIAIERALSKAGIESTLVFATTAENGFIELKSTDFDCIFLDYMLPGKDGLSILQEIREKGINTPIIVTTGRGDEKIAVEMMKAGAWDYLTKSEISSETLAKSLNGALRVSAAEKEKNVALNKLREKEQQLAAVIEYAPIIFFVADRQGIITLLEGAGLHKLGLGSEDGIGKHFSEIFGEKEAILKIIKSALRGNEGREKIQIDKTVFETLCTPLIDQSSKITGIMGVAVDITSHIEVELQLKILKDMAEQNARVRDEFLANMSHEIRTPLNAILGFAKLLLNTKLLPEQHEYLQAINTSGDNLLVIINDILDLSKIEAGMMTFSRTEFDLHSLIRHLADNFAVKAKEKGIAISIDLAPNLPNYVVDDPVRLNQVLLNLVSNAVKFTSKGSVKISARLVSSSQEGSVIKFEVSDTGIGISTENQKKIFENFSQASAETTRKYGGTGLGLTISKKIVNLRGGEISLQSRLGEGSVFSFELLFEIVNSATRLKNGEKENKSIAPRPDIYVLITEDNELNLKLTSRLLDSFQMRYKTANNGQEALDLLEVENFNLILMDIQMPVMDGFETAKTIRHQFDPPKQSIPIIAHTAHAMQEEIDKCLAAGMNDHVSKPYDPAELYSKIIALTDKKSVVKTDSAAKINPVLPAKKQQMPPISPASLPASVPGPYEVIQLDYFEKLTDGKKAFQAEMIDLFIDRNPGIIAEIEAAVKNKDREALFQVIHGVKPSLLMFKVYDAENLVNLTIKMLKSGQNFDDVTPLVRKLVTLSRKAVGELNIERERLASL